MLVRLNLFIITLTLIAVDETISEKCHRQLNCGQVVYNSIYHPLMVEGDPQGCGDPNLQLSCEQNQTVLYFGSNQYKYYVEKVYVGITGFSSVPTTLDRYVAISNFISIRILDPGLQGNNFSTFPLYSFKGGDYDTDLLIFVSCKRPVKSPKYVDTSDYYMTANDQTSSESIYRYVLFGKAEAMVASDIEETCTIYRTVRSTFRTLDTLIDRKENVSFQDIHNAMAEGYELHWLIKSHTPMILDKITIGSGLLALITSIRVVAGVIICFGYLIHKRRRKHSSIYPAIEDFLRTQNNMVPIKYSYALIRKMTDNFKEKLGEGGFGSVYKGKLQSGQFVAVKLLSKSRANDQDFINEVATLGIIQHVNVVRLVGFCAATGKNALVYDYMSNGSLDKVLFAQQPHDKILNWSQIHEIVMGVAQGLKYLHQGCNMQILHFDIKPHNILLDENFVPKLSDFGLAKLRPMKSNAVSMTGARGTIGYIAPELFYKRIGEVSYKADVYSFGMLLMELAGRRRNLNAYAEHSSQIYFPSWIYDQFEQGDDMEFGSDGFSKEEMEEARKLILIGFRCIQMTPNDRPSMKQVLEMLQGDSNDMQLPPKPQFYPINPPAVLEERSYHSSSITDELTDRLGGFVSIEIEQ